MEQHANEIEYSILASIDAEKGGTNMNQGQFIDTEALILVPTRRRTLNVIRSVAGSQWIGRNGG